MSSRYFRTQLTRELPAWLKAGWVTPDGASQLRLHYRLDEPQRGLAALILPVLATVLLLGGSSILLAHNWSELPRGLRVAFAFLPSLLTIGLGVWRLLPGMPRSRAWDECLALAVSLSACLSISLVAQIYHISGDFNRFILVWTLLSIPAALLLRGTLAWCLSLLLATVWLFNTRSSLALPIHLGLLGALCLPTLSPKLWDAPSPCTQGFPRLMLLCCGLLALGHHLVPMPGTLWLEFGLSLAFAFCYMLFLTREEPVPASPPLNNRDRIAARFLRPANPHNLGLRTLLCVAQGILLLTLSVQVEHAKHLANPAGLFGDEIGASVLLLLLAGAWTLFTLRRRHELDFLEWLWVLSPVAILSLTCVSIVHDLGLLALIVLNLYLLALGLFSLLKGLRFGQGLLTHLGWLLICAVLCIRFFNTHLSFMTRGVAFLVLGAGFLVLHRLLSRRSSARKTLDA